MGMFGNRFDVSSALDDAAYKSALNVGQLSSYGVGQMAAYYQGEQGSPFEAALRKQFTPEMQKQNILDELQKKHPSPDTPEELLALADDLMANGFGDMAQKVRIEATNLINANANVLKATKPSADLYKNIESSLSNQILTTDFVNSYLVHKGETELAKPYNKDSSKYDTYGAYKDAKDAYTSDLQNMFSSWANSYKYDGTTKGELATMLNDDKDMTNRFLEHIGVHGNADIADWMIGQIRGSNPSNTPTGLQVVNDDGESVDIDLKDPEVLKIQAEVNSLTNRIAVENQLKVLMNAPNKTQNMRTKVIFLRERLEALDGQAMANVPIVDATGMEQSVETNWFS
jgi:hypothetical protein